MMVKLRDKNQAGLGFFGLFITQDGPPLDLVPLDDQRFTRDGQEKVIPSQYVPPELAKAFRAMQAAIQTEIGVGIFVESGYRSPAQQAITFLTYLNNHHFDAWSTARGVALPGYSQHGDPVHTALDLIDQDGIPTDAEPEKFAHTPAYAWLIEHAQEFGFIQSYPEGNADGIKYEPWHWRYVGLADASAAVDVAA